MRGFRSSPNTSSRLSSNATTKKEQRHQGVVDPIPQRAGGLQRPDPDADGQLPEGHKLIGPRGIGQDQGSDGDHQEDCAARSLDAQERRKRLRQPVDEFARQPIEPRI